MQVCSWSSPTHDISSAVSAPSGLGCPDHGVVWTVCLDAIAAELRRTVEQGGSWRRPTPGARALSNLGAMYLNGLGVKKNEKKAFELIQQAADKGFTSAEFGLGSMYANGRGVKQDLPKAVEWYCK